jgi:phosphoglycolate phosphatase
MKPLIIFDLDGTLVDSKKDLCASVNYVRQTYGLPPLADSTISALIGDGAHKLIERALEVQASQENVRDGLQLFLDFYREHMLDETGLYSGVRETLTKFADCEMAVLTNKPYLFSCALLDRLGIYDYFAAVYGGNSFRQKKPDPVGVFRILSDTKAHPESTWMVGDSAVDVMTGRNAGVATCGVTYGYAADTFEDTPPDFLIDKFDELEDVIRR